MNACSQVGITGKGAVIHFQLAVFISSERKTTKSGVQREEELDKQRWPC